MQRNYKEILSNLSDSIDDEQLSAYFELRDTQRVLFVRPFLQTEDYAEHLMQILVKR